MASLLQLMTSINALTTITARKKGSIPAEERNVRQLLLLLAFE
jgi:hypothetical protein